jgi:alpha-ketoglutarate-dependent taurine dioxygenase
LIFLSHINMIWGFPPSGTSLDKGETMKNPKADFGHLYSAYSPAEYVKHIVRDLKYELPFIAMERLKYYSRALLPQDVIRVTNVGSCHGLDAVVLKYDMTVPEIIARWTNDVTVGLPFPASESEYEITLIDMEAEPLRFARDVNLSDHSFVANLGKPYSAELKQHFAKMTDIVSAVGVMSYISVEGIERIIQAAFVNGNANLFCFTVLKYLENNTYLDICMKHGLAVYHLGDLRQRSYQDEEEKQRIHGILKRKSLLSEADETGLVASLFIAYKEDSIINNYDAKSEKFRTLIVVEQENTLVGSREDGSSHSIEEWPHPWHIALSEEHSQSRAIYQKLTELHIRGLIQPRDVVTTIKSSSVNNVGHMANMFACEYEVSEPSLQNGHVRQTLTRIEPVINANILDEAPASSEELEADLREFGHVMIRSGKPVDEGLILDLMIGNGKAMDYRYGNTARTNINGSSSLLVTPWPKELSVLPHSELTYHTEFPKNMSFICKEPAQYGGETSIYDCAKAFEYLSPDFQRKASTHNVIFRKRYVQALDHGRYPSWQQVVGENTTHEDIMDHFNSMGYHCVVLHIEENGSLTTVVETQLTRPMVYEYQGKQCLHSSVVGIAPYWYEEVWPGKEPPLTATWDNGEPFSFEELRQMENALLSARILYKNWQKHDVMILDNPRIAHGRLPFIGERVIGALVAQPAQFTASNGHWTVELVK